METRDRLRQTLKKKQETVVEIPKSGAQNRLLETDIRPVDELLKFINGEEGKCAKKIKSNGKQDKKIAKAKQRIEEHQQQIDIAKRKAEVNERLKHQKKNPWERKLVMEIEEGHEHTMNKLKEQVGKLVQQKQPMSRSTHGIMDAPLQVLPPHISTPQKLNEVRMVLKPVPQKAARNKKTLNTIANVPSAVNKSNHDVRGKNVSKSPAKSVKPATLHYGIQMKAATSEVSISSGDCEIGGEWNSTKVCCLIIYKNSSLFSFSKCRLG